MLGEPIFEKICTTNVKFCSQTNLLWLSELSTLVFHKLDLKVLLQEKKLDLKVLLWVKNYILLLWFYGSAPLLKSWTLVRALSIFLTVLVQKHACKQKVKVKSHACLQKVKVKQHACWQKVKVEQQACKRKVKVCLLSVSSSLPAVCTQHSIRGYLAVVVSRQVSPTVSELNVLQAACSQIFNKCSVRIFG